MGTYFVLDADSIVRFIILWDGITDFVQPNHTVFKPTDEQIRSVIPGAFYDGTDFINPPRED